MLLGSLPFRKKTSSNVRLNCQLFSGCTCHAQQSIQTCVFLCKKKPFGVFILKYILATFYVWGFPKWHFYFDLLASISGVALLTSKTLNTVDDPPDPQAPPYVELCWASTTCPALKIGRVSDAEKKMIQFFDIFYLFPSDGRLNQFAFFLLKQLKLYFWKGNPSKI